MKCGRVRDLFSRYMENAMDGNIIAKLDEHLAGCELCRHAYERFSATVAMLDGIPEVDPPADFHAAVMAQVERARRTVPTPVKWWSIDWQHVFTIRVPARAAAVGFAVVLLFALAFQFFPPLKSGMMNIIGLQKPSSTQITHIDEDAPRAWPPSNPGAKSDSDLLIGITADTANVYSVRLGTKSNTGVAFQVDVAGTNYSGFVVANRGSVIKVPAPAAGSVAVVGIAWSLNDRGRYESVFLPARLVRQSPPRSFVLQNVKVEDVLRKICRDYGVAIIASGNLGKPVPYAEVDSATPNEALFYSLEQAGMKGRALGSSVFAVEPVR